MKNYYDEEKNLFEKIIWHLKFLGKNYSKVKHDEPKDFNRLIHEVAQIDLRAALYLEKDAWRIENFIESYELEESFLWWDTPQGAKRSEERRVGKECRL